MIGFGLLTCLEDIEFTGQYHPGSQGPVGVAKVVWLQNQPGVQSTGKGEPTGQK